MSATCNPACFCSRDKNETAGLRWPKSFLRCPTFCPKRPRKDTRRDSVARHLKPTTQLELTGMAQQQTSVKSGNRIDVRYDAIAQIAGVVTIGTTPAAIYGSPQMAINDRDASVCASAFAARSAPPPHPRDAGFLLEPIPASSSPADSRAPAAPWCSSPAA